MNKKQLFLLMIAAAMTGAGIVLIISFFSFEPQSSAIPEDASIEERQATVQPAVPPDSVAAKTNFVSAAKKVTPAVVHIKTYRQGGVPRQRNPFHDFFGDPRGPQGRRNPHGDGELQAGSGSGVILTPDGYIATNNHVIDGADKIKVVLNDKRSYEAELVGTDPSTDLALLKIEEKGLSFIPYGNSDTLQIGEWVLAVGNPFDLTSTVTAGIVSAKARNINVLQNSKGMAIESFIQTDAAVNPGNSGGALVNLNGDLIGINTAIATPTGTYAGYAFAVPASLVKKVMNDLLKYGEVQRALLGVSIADVTAELAEKEGIDEIKGVYVAGVVPGGAAEEAGIEEGDIILAVNDSRVNSASKLQEIVARYSPGKKVEVVISREGEERTIKAQLKNVMGTTEIVKKDDSEKNEVLGAIMQPLPEDLRTQLGIEGGVQVIEIRDDKLSEQGLKEGFIITHVDRKRVNHPDDIADLLRYRDGAVLLEGMYPDGTRAYYAFGW